MNKILIDESLVDMAIKIISNGEYSNYMPIEIDYILSELRAAML